MEEFAKLGTVDVFEPSSFAYRGLRKIGANMPYLAAHRSALKRRLSQASIDLVYANSVASGPMVEFASFLNRPVISHIHEMGQVIKIVGPQNLRLLAARSALLVAASDAVKANLVESHRLQPDRIEVVNSFIPTDTVVPTGTRSCVFHEYGIPENSYLICGGGTIDRRKGADLFLDVAKRASRVLGRPVHFLWLGGPEEAAADMQREADKSTARGRIKFVGTKEDVFPYFAACDAFLMTSREEPLGMVMLEASLCRKPVICFAGSGGPPHFVREDAGICVQDAVGMAQELLNLLADQDRMATFGKVGRERVLSRYGIERGARKLADLIAAQKAAALDLS